MAADQSPSFAGLLRRARRDAELTQEELAERAGVSARGISDLERGIIRAPRRDTLELLLEALDLPADERAIWRERREAIAGQPGRSKPPLVTPSALSPFQLPVPRTRLIGREREIVAVTDLIRDDAVPLLTLTGPGGVGKTRLAFVAVDRLKGDFPDGIWSVSLAPLNTPEFVMPMIAAAFGVAEQAGRSLRERVCGTIGERRVLLVLDNLEQVIDAASDIGHLLAGCQNLTILATSRVPLHLYGEREYPVSPLDLPAADAQSSPDQLAGIEATVLFVERVRSVRPGFELTAGNARDVAEICRKLDGLPLAIELAAARTRLFSPSELLSRLDQPLAVLGGGPRDVPARQQTLRNTIAWSYDLLREEERWLFRQLAVFRGGWTLDAAEVVGGPDIDVASGLEGLIEQSLLQAGERRYGMLETIREFAVEQLETYGEADQAIGRHTDYYVDLVERARSGVGPEAGQRKWWTRFQEELDNIRAVLERAVSRSDAALAQSLSGTLGDFWFYGGHYYEARYWLESGLALRGAVPARVRARAHLSLGHTVRQLGDMELAHQCASQALTLFEETGDHVGYVEALVLAGWVNIYSGNFQMAKQWAEQALSAARPTGDKHVTARALDTLCVATAGHLDYPGAERFCTESLALYREVGDQINISRVLGFLGYIAIKQGDIEQAEGFLADALEQADRIGNIDQIAFILGLYGWLELERADYRKAYARFAETLPVLEQEGALVVISWTLEGMAAAADGLDDPQHGARLLGAAVALRERIQSPIQPWRKEQYDRIYEAIRDRIGPEMFAIAGAEGRSSPLEQTIAQSLEWLDLHESEPIGSPSSGLTRRELEVLRLLAGGRSNQEIADALFISPHTAVRHVANIMNKLGVDSRTAAATWAVRNGLG